MKVTISLLTFRSHSVPLKPLTHSHWKWFSLSRQVPPLRQGLDSHSSISVSHLKHISRVLTKFCLTVKELSFFLSLTNKYVNIWPLHLNWVKTQFILSNRCVLRNVHVWVLLSPGTSVTHLTGAVTSRFSSYTNSSIKTLCICITCHWRETLPFRKTNKQQITLIVRVCNYLPKDNIDETKNWVKFLVNS